MSHTHGTLPLFARFITRTMGLHFTKDRLSDLERKMAAVARDAGYAEVEKYLLWLMSAPLSREQLETLARALTIGETYFLRDPRSYQVLEEQLLPELIAHRRTTDKSLRIWSAGCSSGEEPYSIAILLSRIIPDLASWDISILATDINPQALERGRQGVYSKWSFRNAPPWLMDYFTRRKDGRFEIIPRIRKMVRFEHLNLADDGVAPGCCGADAVDIIFCRNVMLYFEPALIEHTLARFHKALRDKGWLFVGPTEVDQRFLKGFTCLRYEGCFVFRKGAPEGEAGTRHRPHLPPLPPMIAPQGEKAASRGRSAQPPQGAAPREPGAGGSPRDAGTGTGREEPAATDGYPEALALYQTGRYEQAAGCVRRALAAGPQPAATLALGARAYANLGRFPEARELCEQAIAADRLSAQNHYLLSIILEQQGNAAAAATSLRHALFIDHDYLLAYFALGNLCRQAGDEGEAERNFANALRLLEKRDPHEVLPEAEGMTAGRLAHMIRAMTKGRSVHARK